MLYTPLHVSMGLVQAMAQPFKKNKGTLVFVSNTARISKFEAISLVMGLSGLGSFSGAV
jgi:hypothetical protein